MLDPYVDYRLRHIWRFHASGIYPAICVLISIALFLGVIYCCTLVECKSLGVYPGSAEEGGTNHCFLAPLSAVVVLGEVVVFALNVFEVA